MKEQETEWKIEENSTTEGTDSGGSERADPAWGITQGDSEKDIDISQVPFDDSPKPVGEMRVRLFDDETIEVTFVELGRWTPGRLEKAMPRIYRECMIKRQQAMRVAEGLPEHFAMGLAGESDV